MTSKPLPELAVGICDFPLNADGLVAVALRQVAVQKKDQATPKQKLTQVSRGTGSKFQVKVSTDDLPHSRAASVVLEHANGSKGWLGELVPAATTGACKDVVATFHPGGGGSPTIDLFRESIFGKGALEVAVTMANAEPTTVRLPASTITFENLFEMELEISGKKLKVAMEDAIARGAFLPDSLLVGSRVRFLDAVLPPALTAGGAEPEVAIIARGEVGSEGKPGDSYLMDWTRIGAGAPTPPPVWVYGLDAQNRIDARLATQGEYFDLRLAFRSSRSDKTPLFTIPLAERLPKPCLQSVTLKPSKKARSAYLDEPQAMVAATTAVAQRPISAIATAEHLNATPVTDANWIQQIDVGIVVTNLHPGATVSLECFVGYTPKQDDPAAKGAHLVARVFNAYQPASPYHPLAVTVRGSAQGYPNPIPIDYMDTGKDFKQVKEASDEKVRYQDVFTILACMREKVVKGSRIIPMRRLFQLWFTEDDGAAVDFTKDFREAHSVATPTALGTVGLDASGSPVRVFEKITVKYDDRLSLRTVPLVPGPNGILFADIPFSLDEAVARHQASYKSKIEVGKTWKDASDSDVRTFLDPQSSENAPISGQFVPIDEYMDLPVDKVRSFLASMEANYHGIGIVGECSQHVLDTAKTLSLNPAYCLCHLMIEWCFLSKGFESDGKTYHNFFGIGATDGNASERGKAYAVGHGWDSVEKALSDGLAYVKNDWIVVRKRRTLYDIRWNMAAMQKEVYATGVRWARDVGWRMDQILSHCGKTTVPKLVKPRFRS
ncbi:MAG: glucosaminidase domain-containing protein [Fibrobacteria bacterium]|nr:glucosaminidase domain-containing protein [Fibrobacteria bacterium]